MAFVLNLAYEKATWVLKEESMEETPNALSENESNELVKAAICHINELKLQQQVAFSVFDWTLKQMEIILQKKY